MGLTTGFGAGLEAILFSVEMAMTYYMAVAETISCSVGAALIAQVVERDLPFYDPSITPDFVTGMNAFCRDMGLMTGDPVFEDVVATEFSNFW